MRRHLSEETRAKISAALKGKTKVISFEQRRKISKTMTGRKLSEKHVQHLRESRVQQASKMRGRKLSAEHCKKVSESLKGHKLSEETRAKISATIKERYPAKKATPVKKKKYKAPKVLKIFSQQTEEERQRIISFNKANSRPWNTGIPVSDATKEKMRISREAGKIKKQKYLEEYHRLYGNESLLPVKQEVPIKQEVEVKHTKDAQQIEDEYYKTHLRPEEWELPMMVIARKRKISVEDLHKIFLNHINAKKII